MSERLKAKIGEELYNQIIAKGIKSNEFDLLEGWIPRSRYNEINDKFKTSESKVVTFEKQLNETKELLKGSEEFKNKYEDLDKKYKNDLESRSAELKNITKRYKLENELIKNNAKHPELLLGRIDLDKISIEGENLIGATDIINDLKTNYKELFVDKVIDNNGSGGNNKSGDKSNSDGGNNWEDVVNKIIGV